MKAAFPFLSYFFEVEWEDNLIIQSFFSLNPVFPLAENVSLDKTGKIISEIISDYLKTGKLDRKNLVLHTEKIPPFYRRVYEELLKVPSGKTITYGELAKRCGKPKAARAVGSAMARNRLMLFIPCHRVVASNGIGGWSGFPGLKETLLKLEKRAV